MAEIRIRLPESSVIVTYASQRERDRSLRLAEARQEMAERTGYMPSWAELASGDREIAALEARNWLRAAVLCGIVPADDEESAAADAAAMLEDVRAWHELSPGGFMIVPPQEVTVKITAPEGGGCRIEALEDSSDEGSGDA